MDISVMTPEISPQDATPAEELMEVQPSDSQTATNLQEESLEKMDDKPAEDEGEIEDNEGKEAKEPPPKSVEDSNSEEPEPASKQSALKQLKSLNFSKRDPFGSTVKRDFKPTSTILSTKPDLPDVVHMRESPIKSDDKQGVHRHTFRPHFDDKGTHTTKAQPGTIKQRISQILSMSDDQAMNMPPDELYQFIMSCIELEREQVQLLNGRYAQIKELESILAKEREEVEKLKKDIPEQLQPPISIYDTDANRNVPPPYTSHPTMLPPPNQPSFYPPLHQHAPNMPPPTFSAPPPNFVPQQPPQQPPPTMPNFTVPPPTFGMPPPSNQGQPSTVNHPPPNFSQPPPNFTHPPPNQVAEKRVESWKRSDESAKEAIVKSEN